MAEDPQNRWEVHDRYGNSIYMTAERTTGHAQTYSPNPIIW